LVSNSKSWGEVTFGGLAASDTRRLDEEIWTHLDPKSGLMPYGTGRKEGLGTIKALANKLNINVAKNSPFHERRALEYFSGYRLNP
jgi:hypothetical protein